jgi:hypothetical protein
MRDWPKFESGEPKYAIFSELRLELTSAESFAKTSLQTSFKN